MLHPVRVTRSPPPTEVGDIGHRVIGRKVQKKEAGPSTEEDVQKGEKKQ